MVVWSRSAHRRRRHRHIADAAMPAQCRHRRRGWVFEVMRWQLKPPRVCLRQKRVFELAHFERQSVHDALIVILRGFEVLDAMNDHIVLLLCDVNHALVRGRCSRHFGFGLDFVARGLRRFRL